MDENSVEKPLLLWRGADSVNKTPLFVSWVNWTQVCNIGYFPCMGCSYFPLPSKVFLPNMILICFVATGVAKTAGSIFMVFSGPVLVIAFLSVPYLIISREEELLE